MQVHEKEMTALVHNRDSGMSKQNVFQITALLHNRESGMSKQNVFQITALIHNHESGMPKQNVFDYTNKLVQDCPTRCEVSSPR